MLAIISDVVSKASLTDWLLLLFGIIASFYLFGTWTYDFFARRGVPSTMPKFPFFGDTSYAFLGLEPMQDMAKKLYDQGKGHGIFGIFEFRKPLFMIRDPELIKIVTVKEFDHFMNHRQAANEKADPIFAKNLFALKDQRWRDMRATMSPAFTTSKMKNMFPLISQCGQQMAGHLREKFATSALSDNTKRYLPTDMKDIFSRVANDVIATAAFGLGCDSLKQPKNEFFKNGKEVTTFSGLRSLLFVVALNFPKIAELLKLKILSEKAVSFFDSIVHETIREREKKNIFRPDVLQLLMQARAGELKVDAEDKDEEEKIKANKAKLSDNDITAQAIIFFFAGFETVSTGLCLVTYCLAMNPHVQKRLAAEVDQVMKETNGKLTYEAVQGMKYLDMVINETLRIHSPAPSSDRECRETTTLPATDNSPAVTLRPGDVIWLPIRGLHLDPEYWPEPEKFDPERFSDENKHKIKSFTYMPFGVGPRICVGQRLALLEVKITLVHLLANFKLYPSPKVKYPMKYKKGFNVMIEGGFWCDLVQRND